MDHLKECASNKILALLKETLEKISMIEFHVNSCPDSFTIEDYRDYEESPLVSLLKVNAFHSTITSYNNSSTSVKDYTCVQFCLYC